MVTESENCPSTHIAPKAPRSLDEVPIRGQTRIHQSPVAPSSSRISGTCGRARTFRSIRSAQRSFKSSSGTARHSRISPRKHTLPPQLSPQIVPPLGIQRHPLPAAQRVSIRRPCFPDDRSIVLVLRVQRVVAMQIFGALEGRSERLEGWYKVHRGEDKPVIADGNIEVRYLGAARSKSSISDMTDSLLISSAISMISIFSSGGSLSNGKGGLVVNTLFPILNDTLVLVPWTAFVIPRAG